MEELRTKLIKMNEKIAERELAKFEEKLKHLEMELEAQMIRDLDQATKVTEEMNLKLNELQREKNRLEVEIQGKPNEERVTLLRKAVIDLEKRLNGVEERQSEFRVAVENCCKSREAIRMEIEKIMENVVYDIMSNSTANPNVKSFNNWLNEEYLSKNVWEKEIDRISRSITTDLQSELVSIAGSEIRSGIQLSAEQLLQNATFKEALKNKITNEVSMTSGQSISEKEILKIIDESLKIYDADKTGMFDFALETAGGTIASTRCTETHDGATAVYSVFGVPIWWDRNTARTILQPNSSPGQCWAFKGSHGAVVIRLISPVRVKAVSLEHISKLLAPDNNINSAPKDFAVLGLKALNDLDPVHLGNFTYSAEVDKPVQTFFIDPNTPNADQTFQLIELRILNNYGNMIYTCLYRFRVHGTVAEF